MFKRVSIIDARYSDDKQTNAAQRAPSKTINEMKNEACGGKELLSDDKNRQLYEASSVANDSLGSTLYQDRHGKFKLTLSDIHYHYRHLDENSHFRF